MQLVSGFAAVTSLGLLTVGGVSLTNTYVTIKEEINGRSTRSDVSMSIAGPCTVTYNLSQPPTPRSISTPLLIATAMATTLDPETLPWAT